MSKWVNDIKGARVNPDMVYLYTKWSGLKQANPDKYKVCDTWYYFSNFVKDVQSMELYNTMINNKEDYSMRMKPKETIYNKDNFIIIKNKKRALRKRSVDTVKYHMSEDEYEYIVRTIHKIYSKKTYYKDFYDELNNIINMEAVRASHTYSSTAGKAFVSYACDVIKSGVGRHFRDANRLKRRAVVESLDVPVVDDVFLHDLLPSYEVGFELIEEHSHISYILNKLELGMKPNYKRILFMRAKGESMKDIANSLGVSRAEVYRQYKRAQEQAQLIYNSI